MSLFKVKEWWFTKLHSAAHNDYFNPACLTVDPLQGGTDNFDRIVLGSLSGILRIYDPQRTSTGDNEATGNYRASDLLLEVQLKEPILQVAIGIFVKTSSLKSNHIAILHPRRLIVGAINATEGATEHGNQFQFVQLVEHQLERSAYCMCCGQFGGSKDHDLIAVQSLDCTLTIFEPDQATFSQYLPNSLLPGPLCYWATADSFLTVSSLWLLESYRYESLAMSAEVQKKEAAATAPGQQPAVRKRISPDWAVNLGEMALQISIASPSKALILGFYNVFCVNDLGKALFSIKMDYNPISLYISKVSSESVSFIVTNHFGSLMFYEDELLRWSAHLPAKAACLAVANLKSFKGGIVTVSQTAKGTAHVSVGYLGTDPTLHALAPPLAARDINWGDYEREMKQLDGLIRKRSSDRPIGNVEPRKEPSAIRTESSGVLLSSVGGSDMTVKLAFETSAEQLAPAIGAVRRRNQAQSNVVDATSGLTLARGQLILSPRISDLNSVRIAFIPCSPLTVEPAGIVNVGHIGRSNPATLRFQILSGTLPAGGLGSLRIRLAVSYSIPENSSRNFDNEENYDDEAASAALTSRLFIVDTDIPLHCVVKPVPVGQQDACKITLETSRSPSHPGEIFPELVHDSATETTPGVSADFILAPTANSTTLSTVLASKNSTRYRVQGASLSACSLLIGEMASRLASRQETLRFTGNLLELIRKDVASLIRIHLEARTILAEAESTLAKLTNQMIVVEKRLLSKLREQSTKQDENIQVLVEFGQKELENALNIAEIARAAEMETAGKLAAGIRAICRLVRLSPWQVEQANYDSLVSALQPDQLAAFSAKICWSGWEEMADAAILCLLSTFGSGKAGPDSVFNPTILTQPTDLGAGLVEHLCNLLDRMSKGKISMSTDDSIEGQTELKLTSRFALEDHGSKRQDAPGGVVKFNLVAKPIDSKDRESLPEPSSKKKKDKAPPPPPPSVKPNDASLPPVPSFLQEGDGNDEGFLPPPRSGKVRTAAPPPPPKRQVVDLPDLDAM